MENKKAYIITGPTSGIGYETALELAKYGTVILVGRNREKLEQVQKVINNKGQKALLIVCDISRYYKCKTCRAANYRAKS